MAVTIQTEPTLAAGAGPALNVIQGWARDAGVLKQHAGSV